MKEQIDLSREYGMVLEGGGARGAYQIGAWKALREAGVRIKGIAGTSVGALNGALICMDHVEFAEAIWKTMAYSRVMDVDDAMMESLRKMDMKALDLYGLLNDARRVFTEKGVDITPLKKLIAGCVDEEKIRNSPCEFYVTTYSVTDRKEIDVNMKEVPPGTMKDILLASAFFLALKARNWEARCTWTEAGSTMYRWMCWQNGDTGIFWQSVFSESAWKNRCRLKLPDPFPCFRSDPREILEGFWNSPENVPEEIF